MADNPALKETTIVTMRVKAATHSRTGELRLAGYPGALSDCNAGLTVKPRRETEPA